MLRDVRPLFLAGAQPTELIEPREGSLHHPAPSTQSAAVFGVADRKKRGRGTNSRGQRRRPRCKAQIPVRIV
jgi:hypothetical protein